MYFVTAQCHLEELFQILLIENVSHGGELLLKMVLLKVTMARLILVVLMLQYF
jgi:hypothetical protein